MNINSRKDSGGRVTLSVLDLADSPRPDPVVTFTAAKEHLLYVDDDRQVLEMGRRFLTHLGYRVTALTSSLEAREVFLNRPQAFDLVITDLNMPLVSGLDLAAAMVQVRPEMPIILYSGVSEAVPPEIASQAGIRGVLRKPTNIADLAGIIRRLLDTEEE